MVRNRVEAAKRAEATYKNVPNTCQLVTREWYDAPSVGDFDGDGAADAEDGWKSEPVAKRHPGDRKPPRGTPVAYSGGSKDNGHRAMSLGPIGGVYMIRSTDAGGTGKTATVPLDWPEKHWGLKYLGWSDTIDGKDIPEGPKAAVPTAPPVKKPATQASVTVTFGVDAAHYQFDKGFDLALLKPQGYDYVILKCTQGTSWYDKTYAKARAKAEKLGLLTAAYHFLEEGHGAAQADNLFAHIIDKTLPVFIDVEPSEVIGSKPTMTDWVAFRDRAKQLGLKVKAKYLTESYWEQIGKPKLDGPLLLWRAAYPSSRHAYGSVLYPGNNHERWSPFGGQTPTIWQFASSGKLDGFSENVDLNAFRGNLAQLKKKNIFKDYSAIKAADPKPAPKPTPKPKPIPKPVPQKPQPQPPPKPKPKPAPASDDKVKEFKVFLVPGNKSQTMNSVKEDMGRVLNQAPGDSAVVFNTERESATLLSAVKKGLGKGFTVVFDNECPIAYDSNWEQVGKPQALLLAAKDPHLEHVSGDRHLNTLPLGNKIIKQIRFKGTHLLSEANCEHIHINGRKWREKMWPIQLNDVLDDVQADHKAGFPVVLAGDFNTGIHFTGKQVYALLVKRFGAKNVVHVHNGSLDQIFLISTDEVELSEEGVEKDTNNASDHDMIAATIRARVRS